VLLLSIVAHVIFAVVALSFFGKCPDGKKRLLRLATIFSNAAFMGIPLISAIYAGTPIVGKATIYASIYNITFNLFLWSLGVYICTKDRDDNNDGVLDPNIIEKKNSVSPLKALYHPATIASVLGIIVILLNLKTSIPSVFGNTSILNDSLEMLRGLVAPLSMVVIGIRLADMNFKGFFNDGAMYLSLALRHLVLPLLVVGATVLLKLLGLPVSSEIFTVTVVLAAAPAASSATMFAEKFDCDAIYVSRVVVASTLISIATMPAVLYLGSLILEAI
jgi:predicted permease